MRGGIVPQRGESIEDARRGRPVIYEADLEKYGTDLLELDGWRSLKTDPVRNREWGKGFGEVGMADRLYIRYAGFDQSQPADFLAVTQTIWIEWKRIRPGRRSAEKAKLEQRIWIEAERARGALVLLAGYDFEATPEGFLEWYRGSGLMRKAIA